MYVTNSSKSASNFSKIRYIGRNLLVNVNEISILDADQVKILVPFPVRAHVCRLINRCVMSKNRTCQITGIITPRTFERSNRGIVNVAIT